MKGELISGIAFIIVGLVINILNQDKTSTNTCRKNSGKLFKNAFYNVFMIVGFLSLSLFFLDIKYDEILWKNGIYLFFVILSLIASTDKIIDWIFQKMEKKKKAKDDLV